MAQEPTFFRNAAALRRWFQAHHAKETELIVGFRKVGTGEPSVTWPESIDEALCVGWIDGVRRRIDDASYQVRFTPRKAGSTWSAVNAARARALIAEGRMRSAGLAAFEARSEKRSGIYSYEQRSVDFDEPYASMLRRNAAASAFFESQPPSYRRAATWFVVSAKREQTRQKRLEKLIAYSARGERIPEFLRPAPKKRGI